MHQRVIITVVLLLFSLSGCGYNTLLEKNEQTRQAWSDIDTTLQRRADLIPNLVETVKGYADFEKETLEAVVSARAKATSVQLTPDDLTSAAAMSQFQSVQNGLSSALSRLLLVVERYPDLKANQGFLDLQSQLEGTENRINVARQRYNKAVGDFNFSIKKFPYNLTNMVTHRFEEKEYFKADEEAKEAPKVKF